VISFFRRKIEIDQSERKKLFTEMIKTFHIIIKKLLLAVLLCGLAFAVPSQDVAAKTSFIESEARTLDGESSDGTGLDGQIIRDQITMIHFAEFDADFDSNCICAQVSDVNAAKMATGPPRRTDYLLFGWKTNSPLPV
jgi:hypothetical protein